MEKIAVLDKLLERYQRQRAHLNDGLLEMSYSEPTALEKRQAIEKQIYDIDNIINQVTNNLITITK